MNRLMQIPRSFGLAVRYCVFPAGLPDDPSAQRLRLALVTVWGLVYGVILCAVFAGGWKYFGDIYFSEYSRLRIVPAALVILVTALLGFRQLLGLAVTVDRLTGRSPQDPATETIPAVKLPGQLALFLAILMKFSALLAMPYLTPWLPGDWRRYFSFLYPRVMYYRVFLLMGLWGRMGLLIAGATGPTAPNCTEQDRTFRRKMTIRTLAANLVFSFLITAIYFSQRQNRAIGILVSLVIFLAVYLVSMFLAWRLAGHDRHSMFACGEISEILLLFGYLAIARYL